MEQLCGKPRKSYVYLADVVYIHIYIQEIGCIEFSADSSRISELSTYASNSGGAIRSIQCVTARRLPESVEITLYFSRGPFTSCGIYRGLCVANTVILNVRFYII